MSVPNGKIGCLPEDLREQVNCRLATGERAEALLAWLNAHPAVQAMLAREFSGQPVSAPNFSRWRTGGHQAWLITRERWVRIRELTASGRTWPDRSGLITVNYAKLR